MDIREFFNRCDQICKGRKCKECPLDEHCDGWISDIDFDEVEALIEIVEAEYGEG